MCACGGRSGRSRGGRDWHRLLGRGLTPCLEAFLSSLQVGILGEVSGEDLSRIFISFPGVIFQGCGLC